MVTHSEAPPYLRVSPLDNVAIVVDPLGYQAREHIPQSHKIALTGLARNEPVIRYGQVIGLASRDIDAGSWVREEMLTLPAAPPLDPLPLATAVPAPLPPLEGFYFEGFRNADGSVGTKNILGLVTTVQCVAPTVDYAVRRIKAELLPRFPNVDDVVAITHTYGCGVAIDAPGAAIPIRTLKHISMHPNLGGRPLVVSLGCEKLQPARLFANELPILENANIIRLQDRQGFAETVAAILEAAAKRLDLLESAHAAPMPRSGSDRGSAVRRQRRVLGRHVQSRGRATRPTCWCAREPRSSSPK